MNKPAPVFIGLTSIRGREGALKRTLDSLLAQQLPADGRLVELHLFLSREPYLLDRGFAALPGFLRRRIWRSRLGPGLRLQVHWTANWGPYRKLLPLLERLTPEQQALDPLLITADDDTLYPRDWLRRLVAAQERWGCVVAFRGRQMVLEQGEVCPTATGECAMWSGPWRSPATLMICGSRPTRCSLPRRACCCTTA